MQKENDLDKIEVFLSTLIELICSSYIVAILVVLPLYYTNGYARIGTDKALFFQAVVSILGKILIPCLVVYFLCKIKNKRKTIVFSLVDIFVLVYGVAVIFSFLCSNYRGGEYLGGNPWEGANGWYMGAKTHLVYVGVYFLLTRFWPASKKIISLIFPVSFLIFLLAILNRFQIYPLQMSNAQPQFISTIGNINWYCGYLVTLFFGAVYYWFYINSENKINYIWLLIYLVAGFTTLITQGSSSGLIPLVVCFFVIMLSSLQKIEEWKKFLLLNLLFFLCCFLCTIIITLIPEQMNYYDISTKIVTNHYFIGVYGFLIFAIFCVINFAKEPLNILKKMVIGGFVLITVFLIIGVILLFLNTKNPGSIGFLSEYSLFTFSETWGSNRGATWMAGWQIFKEQDVIHKIFGIGSDSMANYIAKDGSSQLQEMITSSFNGARLTNAHNEWLTLLINEGLFGAIAYIGMILSSIFTYLKVGKKNPVIGGCGMGILAYTVNNMFSFQTAMSTTTMFLLLSIGQIYYKSLEKEKGDYLAFRNYFKTKRNH